MATRTAGRSKMVMEAIRANFGSGEQFHCSDLKVSGLTEKQVTNSLSMLARKDILVKGDLKGYYYLPGEHEAPNPAQAVYDLLDFMARAEKPLRRAARILEAVEGVK